MCCHWEHIQYLSTEVTPPFGPLPATPPQEKEGHVWFGSYPFTESTTVMLQHVLCNLFAHKADMSSGTSCLSQGLHSTSHNASWGPFKAAGWRWGASIAKRALFSPRTATWKVVFWNQMHSLPSAFHLLLMSVLLRGVMWMSFVCTCLAKASKESYILCFSVDFYAWGCLRHHNK